MDNSKRHFTSTHDECDDMLNAEEKDIFTSDIELPNGKKIRLNPPARLLDVGDEGLSCILLKMFGCKRLDVLQPRILQNMISAYGFIHANNRMLQVFRDVICNQVHSIDTNFPSFIEEDVMTLSTFKHPKNIYFLAKMIGDSLQAVSLPCYLTGPDTRDDYQHKWERNGRRMMLGIAKTCTKLRAITFQDSGVMEEGIAKRFLASNPGLKRIVVHSPTPAFLSALTKSDCVLEYLILLHVGLESFGAVLKFLLEKGGSLNSLSIETSAPFTGTDEPSAKLGMRYRRMVKRFMLRFEKIADEKLESLSTVVLQPFRETQWYNEFIQRFQRMGRAKLITGVSSRPYIYPPASSGEVPPALCKTLHLDYISHCETEEQFRHYLERVELPDSLFGEGINLFFKLVDSHLNDVSSFVKAAIREKGRYLMSLRLTCAVYSREVFTEFLDGMGEIFDTFEESFGSLTQLRRLEIPIDLITYLVEDRGHERFLVRLGNLKEIFLTRPLPYMYLDVETPKAIPKFLKCLTNACRKLKCVYIASGHHTHMCSNVSVRDLARAKEAAYVALDEFEEENMAADVHTLRKQVLLWGTTSVSPN